jgi:hypothetical protein
MHLLVGCVVSLCSGWYSWVSLAQQVMHGWFQRSDQAKADQPHWMTPLVTITPRLDQEFRTDFMALGSGFQIAATEYHTYNHAWLITIRFPF